MYKRHTAYNTTRMVYEYLVPVMKQEQAVKDIFSQILGWDNDRLIMERNANEVGNITFTKNVEQTIEAMDAALVEAWRVFSKLTDAQHKMPIDFSVQSALQAAKFSFDTQKVCVDRLWPSNLLQRAVDQESLRRAVSHVGLAGAAPARKRGRPRKAKAEPASN